MKAKDVMSTRIVTVGPGHNVRHAAQIMLEHAVSGLPVVGDEGKLAGMLTEGDLMRRMELGGVPLRSAEMAANRTGDAIWSYVRNHSWRVEDVMSKDVIAVTEDTPLYRIAEIMEQNSCKRVPVLRDGMLVGLVSRADLLRAIVAAPADQVAAGDVALKKAIEARLQFDVGLQPSQVTVVVCNGEVMLSGSVESEALREAARVAAEGVHGCQGVTNAIAVPSTDGARSRSPETVKPKLCG